VHPQPHWIIGRSNSLYWKHMYIKQCQDGMEICQWPPHTKNCNI
jgi:hypothetical protein